MTAIGDDQSPQQAERYESFVQAFARHEPGLRSFVRPLVPAWNDMQEVIQETCVVLWRKYDQFEPGTDFLSWACTVARFEALKYRRARARDRHLFGEELIALLADEGVVEAEVRERERRALERCVQKLPHRQRELIERCYSGGASIKEVAVSLGRSATGLYKALDRIRAILMQCIEHSLAQEGVP
jgi:RNA polymerase sigma-70 factor (ECF subfamily)